MYPKFRGAFPTYKKIRRKSTGMAQCRKHGAIPQKRRNGNSARARTAQSRAKNGAIIGKNGAFQHQNLKPYLFPKERRMPEISAAIRWNTVLLDQHQNFDAARVSRYGPSSNKQVESEEHQRRFKLLRCLCIAALPGKFHGFVRIDNYPWMNPVPLNLLWITLNQF